MLKAEYRLETEKPWWDVFWGFPTQDQAFPPDPSPDSKERYREHISGSSAVKAEK